MNIASHCLPGRYAHYSHTPFCAWPDDCYVQWGAHGVVLPNTAKGKCYETAFFEAFPSDPKTFIRGEGKDIESAERSAFSQFERFQACSGHEFERRNYTNGGGICKHCGLFKSEAFEPIPEDPNRLPSPLEILLGGLGKKDMV